MAIPTDDLGDAVDALVQRMGGADEILGKVIRIHKNENEAKAAAYQLPFLSLAQLEQASQAVSWSVKTLIPADSVGMMFGASGTFKSFVALDLALHIAHGMRWLGFKTTKGPVIYIAAEGGTGLWRRIKAWHMERGLHWGAIEFHVVPVAVNLSQNCQTVVEAAKTAGVVPTAVFVDTLSQTFDGDENSATDVPAYLRGLGNAFRALWKCFVLVVHHSGHSATERPRGSSTMLGNTDFLIGVFRDEKEMLATLTWFKQKDGELPPDAAFGLRKHVLGHDEDGDEITSLAARYVAEGPELDQARQLEVASGRSGRNAEFLNCCQNGALEKEVRHVFYETMESTDPEVRRKAYFRARAWAIKSGFIEVADKHILVLRSI
jgi:hypothetical protein